MTTRPRIGVLTGGGDAPGLNHPPDIVPVFLADVVGRRKRVPIDYDLLVTARALGISLGDVGGPVL